MRTKVLVGDYWHYKVCDACGLIQGQGYPSNLCPGCGQRALRNREGRIVTTVTRRWFRPEVRTQTFEPVPSPPLPFTPLQ